MFKVLLENPARLSVFVVVIMFLLILLTQLAVPLIRETPLFPIFSRKPRINSKIHQVNEETEEERLLAELQTKRTKLEQEQRDRLSRNTTKPTTPPPVASEIRGPSRVRKSRYVQPK